MAIRIILSSVRTLQFLFLALHYKMPLMIVGVTKSV